MTSPYTAVSFNHNHSVQLDTLLRHIMPMIPEAPHAMVLDRIRQSYTEFARRSSLLVAKITQDFQAGVSDYGLEPPDGYEIYSVLGLDCPGYRFVDYWGGQCSGLWNTKFDVVDNRSIYIHRAPTVDGPDGLSVYVVVLPAPCVSLIPASIATPFGRAIAEGALADVMLTPNKAWTNVSVAGIHKLEFNRGVLAARHLSETNRQRGPLRMKKLRVI